MDKVLDLVKKKDFPYVTVCLIAVNIIYYFIIVLGGSTADKMYMLSMGADYAPYVFEELQVWRLITSMFMHFSFRHLAGNMIYLGILGVNYEKVTGHLKFFLIYMLSGLGSSLVSCAYHQIARQPVISAGASGAVYGLIAMVIYLMYIARKRMGTSRLMYRIAVTLIFLFYSNFVTGTGVDIAAHIGGLVFGLILCLIFLPAKKK